MRVSPWLRFHCEVHHSLASALASIGAHDGTVYLCGGINGLSDTDCADWRNTATEALKGHLILDPMARDYRGREDECVAEIVEGDKEDILKSGVLLVNASKASWGTAMEIMFAWSLRKRIVAFMEVK
jgi:hypothetical protein